LGIRHHLATPGADVVAVVGDLVALHSSDPGTVFLSAQARVDGFRRQDLETALYDERSLVRMHGMRRTLFVFPAAWAETVNDACTRTYLAAERTRLVGYLESQGLANDGEAWLDDVALRALESIGRRGAATAAEIKEDVPEFGLKLHLGEGKSWGGSFGVSTRILFLLATAGKILRGRPRGSWLSSQYQWVVTAQWLGFDLEHGDERLARANLLGRWLGPFGPATEIDVRWWTGWTAARTRTALRDIGAVKVELNGGEGYVHPDDQDQQPTTEPWAALLPALDPTVMGWKERHWYVGEHGARLFDRNGNAGPTIWWSGKVVGGWAQTPDGSVAIELLEDLGREATQAIENRAHCLEQWLGTHRPIPRFRTPLEKGLTKS